jgi:4-hydroxybenzoate polyprenyltransferase
VAAARVSAAIRLVHPAPAAAVVCLSAALTAILTAQGGLPWWPRAVLVVLSVAGSQVATGALNDLADRERDARLRPEKPIPAGQLTPRAALAIGLGGLALAHAT